MKKARHLLFSVLAMTLILGGSAVAQAPAAGDNSVYFVTYYSNANTSGVPDATLRLVADGEDGAAFADIYVFDDSQELQECCSCFVSADGLLSESVNKQLTANELTGRAENTRGVIKVISGVAHDPTFAKNHPNLRGWMTHIQAGATKTTFSVTEDPLADSNLSPYEVQALEQSCSFAITLGSGYGVCSCTPEDNDF